MAQRHGNQPGSGANLLSEQVKIVSNVKFVSGAFRDGHLIESVPPECQTEIHTLVDRG